MTGRREGRGGRLSLSKVTQQSDLMAYLTSTFAVKYPDSHQGSFLGNSHHPAHSCGPNVSAMSITIRCILAVCCKTGSADHSTSVTDKHALC